MRDTAAYKWIESLIYSRIRGIGFTQRSPIMLDVWIHYGMGQQDSETSKIRDERLDLLLVTRWGSPGVTLADELRSRLSREVFPRGGSRSWRALMAAQIAPTQSVAAAILTYRELMRIALPLSPWWHRYLLAKSQAQADKQKEDTPDEPASNEPSRYFASEAAFKPLRKALRQGLESWDSTAPRVSLRDAEEPLPTSDFIWLAKVAGGIALLQEMAPTGLVNADKRRLLAWRKACADPDRVLKAFFKLFKGVEAPTEAEPLWSVHRNRDVEVAIRESTATVKADAARKVFDIRGRGIRWGVIDTGIDSTHIAFRKRDGKGDCVPYAADRVTEGGLVSHSKKSATRIIAAYDFSHVRKLMAGLLDDLEAYRDEVFKDDPRLAALKHPEMMEKWRLALERTRDQYKEERIKDRVRATMTHEGRSIDWDVWDSLLRMPMPERELGVRRGPYDDIDRRAGGVAPNEAAAASDEGGYPTPTHEHGTHVAGIIAADWRPEDRGDDAVVEEEIGTPRRLTERTGMCPEIELYDLRVTREDGRAEEFAVLAALQFVRAINARHDHLEIHGVNLSLSLNHEVSNFACGRTPVCDECERLVGNGVIVVAAAGNNGRAMYMTSNGAVDEAYRTVSITDPGNAPSVITVGATHRAEPHAYGVSYFSSRGPTGDGRPKPDLVAPGEKVMSTVPGQGERSLDGTSMAAPHVSGAAALLLCRYPELIGKPAEVKRILCSTATDLGRDRYFQGAGLLDVLRALESF